MFCKCIAVGNRRLSGNNQNTYCSLVFALLYKLCHCLFASVDLHCLHQPLARCGCWERMGVGGEVVA